MSEPVFINTKVIPEKKKVGRPRKLKDIPNGIPSIEQQFRIFKNITEPYLLQKAEIPEKDFFTKMKEMEYDTKTADEKAVSSFKGNKIDIRTDENVDEIALRNMRNDAVKNLTNNNKKKAAPKKSSPKKKLPSISQNDKGTLTEDIDIKTIPKNTMDGKKQIYEIKNISKSTLSSDGSKTSQGNSSQIYTKTGKVSQQGSKQNKNKIARPRNIN